MNKDQHITIGLLAFIAYVVIIYSIRPFALDAAVYGGIAAVLCSVLPDWIDPPTDWKHRAFGHSKRVLRNAFFLLLVFTVVSLFYSYALVASGGLLGYTSHLAADWITPAGLPD